MTKGLTKMIELFNKFQNSKLWSKLKPTEPRWVIIVLVIAVVLIAYKNLSVTPQEKTAKFVCPENYPDQATADKNNEAFIENYFKSNPDDSLTDFISYRYHTLAENNCTVTLEYTGNSKEVYQQSVINYLNEP